MTIDWGDIALAGAAIYAVDKITKKRAVRKKHHNLKSKRRNAKKKDNLFPKWSDIK